MLSPDTVFSHGRFAEIGAAGERIEFSALAVRQGRVIARGTSEEVLALAGPDTVCTDLGGRRVLPGFIESHIHLAMLGLTLLQVDVRPEAAGSIAEIQQAIARAAEQAAPGEWIWGFGWDESRLADRRVPTRDDLDAAAPHNPVRLTRTCAHMAVINSQALRASGIAEDAADPDGGALVRDAEGRLTGLIQEKALNLIADPPTTPADVLAGIECAQERLLSWGITTVHDLATQGEHLRAVARLRADGKLKIRVRPWMWAVDGNGWKGHLESLIDAGITSGMGDDWVKLQGVKFMLDGSVGGLTAAVREPYVGTCCTGILVMDFDEAAPEVEKALRAGLRTAIHGIGERAVDVAVDALAHAARTVPQVPAMRCRVEHCALPEERAFGLMAQLNIIAGSSVGFLHKLGDRYLDVLGPERMARAYPQRTFLERGITAPPNSDCPITDANPWHIISSAVTRTSQTGRVLDTVQNVTLDEALRSLTHDAAYASFEEDRLGTLQVGAHADFVVFDDDPLDAPVLADVRCSRTYVAGELRYGAE